MFWYLYDPLGVDPDPAVACDSCAFQQTRLAMEIAQALFGIPPLEFKDMTELVWQMEALAAVRDIPGFTYRCEPAEYGECMTCGVSVMEPTA